MITTTPERKTTIELKRLTWMAADHSPGAYDTIRRTPVKRVGWRKVRYQGRWFQLHGGVRVNPFINTDRPLPTIAGGRHAIAGDTPVLADAQNGGAE